MKTVLMAVAIVKDQDKILIRKMDPNKNPYAEPWALFGGRLDGDGSVEELLNIELKSRWHMEVKIIEKLWWDEETKVDNDGEEKRFIYLDALCILKSGEATPVNPREELRWVSGEELAHFPLNPPSRVVLNKAQYI